MVTRVILGPGASGCLTTECRCLLALLTGLDFEARKATRAFEKREGAIDFRRRDHEAMMRSWSFGIIVALALTLISATASGQMAASFGGAALAPVEGLREAPPLHHGIFCLSYSGIENRVAPEYNVNTLSAAVLAAKLQQYQNFDHQFASNNITPSNREDGYKKLVKMARPALLAAAISDPALREALNDVDNDVLGKTREDINELDDTERERLSEIEAHSYGLTKGAIDFDFLVRAKLPDLYGRVFGFALQSQDIPESQAIEMANRFVYFENLATWGLTPELMRAQLRSERSYALFNEGKFDEALADAQESLRYYGANPEPYVVTTQDDEGHRRPGFSRNLAFVIARLSEFALARNDRDPEKAFSAAADLLRVSAPLHGMMWYLMQHRDWAPGREMYGALLSHFADNVAVAMNPRIEFNRFSTLRRNIDAFWRDDQTGATYAVMDASDANRSDKVTIEVDGQPTVGARGHGGGQPPAPPETIQFSDSGPPKLPLVVVPGDDARRRLIQYLREQIDAHSIAKVALFTVLEEEKGFRVIMPTDRLAAIKARHPDAFGEFDTFFVDADAIDGTRTPPSGEPLSEILSNLNGAALTMYAAPHSVMPSRFQASADRFAFKFVAASKGSAIFRDIYTSETNGRSEAMLTRELATPDKYAIITATKDTGVDDRGIIGDLTSRYIDPMKIAKYAYDGSNAKEIGDKLSKRDQNVILITAHAGKPLRDMVYDLGRAGAFDGNVVIFMSCREPLSRSLTEYMGGKGARAVVVTDRKIMVDKTLDTLSALLSKLAGGKSAKELLRQVVLDTFADFGGLISVSTLYYKDSAHVRNNG